jgi:hypothetical protein
MKTQQQISGALCLYGQPRFFWNNDTLIRNIIDYNKNNGISIDVFFHTWWDQNASAGTFYEIAPWAQGSHPRNMTQLDMSTYNIHYLIQMYNPRNHKVDPPKDFSKELNIPENAIPNEYTRRGNLLSQYYSSKISSVSRNESKEQYDFIIRARFDTFVEHPLDIRKYLTDDGEFPKNTMIIPDNCHNHNLYNDNFSVSTPEIHQYICSLYNYVQKYLDDGIPYLAEELFRHHLQNYKDNTIIISKDPNIRQMFFRGVNYVHP